MKAKLKNIIAVAVLFSGTVTFVLAPESEQHTSGLANEPALSEQQFERQFEHQFATSSQPEIATLNVLESIKR